MVEWCTGSRVDMGRSERHLQGTLNGRVILQSLGLAHPGPSLRTAHPPGHHYSPTEASTPRERRAAPAPAPAPTLFSPRPNLPVSAAAARTGRRSPAARDEHRHHRVGEAGVPGGGSEPAIHQGRRQLLRARLPPPLHHLRRLRHRRLPLRDQAGDPRAVDGDGGPHRGHGRIHVRLPELRRPPHGLLPQRRRGRALQAQAVAASLSLSVPSYRKCYIFSDLVLASLLDVGNVWPWLNKGGTLLHSCEEFMLQFS